MRETAFNVLTPSCDARILPPPLLLSPAVADFDGDAMVSVVSVGESRYKAFEVNVDGHPAYSKLTSGIM